MTINWEQVKRGTVPKTQEEKYVERMMIYAQMKIRKIKQGDVAEKFGVTKQWVSQYFNGKVDFNKTMEEELFTWLAEEFKK